MKRILLQINIKFLMIRALIINILIMIIFLAGCTTNQSKVYDLNFDMYYNTVNNVKIVTTTDKEEKLEIVYQEIDKILLRIDRLFNVQEREDQYKTELMMINENSGMIPTPVSDEVIFVLKKAIEVAKMSEVNGIALFDPTIAPVWDRWNFIESYYSIYNPIIITIPDDITEYLPLVDYHKIKINEIEKTVFLETKGMKLDLGGIVKGYVADCIRSYLQQQGFHNAVIDIGKNLIIMGTYQKKGWKTSLQTPYIERYSYTQEEQMYYYGRFYLSDKTLVTSGVYEKYVVDKDQKEYHHILDPRTGFPFNNQVISVSVITDSSIEADGYSTTLLALGLEKGMELVSQTSGLEAVYVIKNNDKYEVYISKGLQDQFEFNENVIQLGYEYKGVFGE